MGAVGCMRLFDGLLSATLAAGTQDRQASVISKGTTQQSHSKTDLLASSSTIGSGVE
jgi:hypothetical protein